MPYKPWTIILISLIYFLSPPVILISSALVSMVPLTGPYGILHRLTPGDISVLILYIIIAIALFSVKKWGWWTFIILSLCLLSYNVAGYIMNPFYSPLSLIIYNLLLTSSAALFFRKEYIAPYFNPRLRWWESDKRYSLKFECSLDLEGKSYRVPVIDISRGGCYIGLDWEGERQEVLLEITLNKLFLSLKGALIRPGQTPVKGWGIVFRDLTIMDQRGLSELLGGLSFFEESRADSRDSRKHSRFLNPRYGKLIFSSDDSETSLSCEINNISSTGCSLYSSGEYDYQGSVTINFLALERMESEKSPLEGDVIWKSPGREGSLTGVRFRNIKKDKKRIRSLIRAFRKLGGRERRTSKETDKKLIEESVSLSPRRFFMKRNS